MAILGFSSTSEIFFDFPREKITELIFPEFSISKLARLLILEATHAVFFLTYFLSIIYSF
jgi:hypothetical protein